MTEYKKSNDGTYMYKNLCSKIKMCMAIFCSEARRKTCVWHKRWQDDRSLVGAYFGKSCEKCDYYKPIE